MRFSANGLAGLHPELETLLRRGDPKAGQFLEALKIARADVRQTKAHWNAADSLTGLQVRDDGGVQLAETVKTLIPERSPHNTYFTDLDLDARFPFACPVVEWAGAEPAHIQIKRVKAWLHPRRNAGNPQTVTKWKLELLRVVKVGGLLGIPAKRQLFCAPLCDPVYADVVGSAEGLVTFDFSVAPVQERPRPKQFGYPAMLDLLATIFNAAPAPTTLLVFSGLDKNGAPATNIGLGYDNTVASVTTNGNILASRKFVAPFVAPFPSLGPLFQGGTHGDNGSGGGTPRLIIEYGTYTNDELALTQVGNRIDLGGVPVDDVVFTINGSVPTGTALTGQVLKDGGNPATEGDWRTFLSGQKSTDLADVSKRQTYELRAKLLTDASSSLTPVLRKLAVEEVTTNPAYDAGGNSVARIQLSGGYGIDLLTLKGEVVEGMLIGILDGERDYKSWIENLLADGDLKDYTFRLWCGAAALSKDKWLHIDDYLPKGQHPRQADYAIPIVSVLTLVRGLLPKKSPGASYAPDGDVDVGGYTTDAGGGANLYTRVNEADADDATYIQSAVDPVNAIHKESLPTPADLPGRRLYVDYRIRKDQAGGKTIDMTIELRQSSTLIATSGVQANVSDAITPGSFQLSDASVALITDPANLQLWVTSNVGGAGGSRRGIVTWWRFRTEDRRQAVSYANQSVKAVYDDLLANQLEVDVRYRGPGLEDTTTLISKTISEVDDDEQPTGKDELDAVAHTIGYGILGSQARLKAVNMKDPTEVRFVWPMEETRILSITQGIEDRIDNYVVPFNWNVAKEQFDDEWEGASAAGVLPYGDAKNSPLERLPQEVAEWVQPQAIADYAVHARAIGTRILDWFATGRGRALIETDYMFPELEPGDTGVFETDQLVVRDPHTGEARRGRMWLSAKIELCDDPDPCAGRRFTVAIRPLHDLFGPGSAAVRQGFERPVLDELTPNVTQQGVVTAVLKGRGAGSVKVAVSTSSEPTAATVRATLAQNLDADGILRTGTLATITPSQTLYIAAFAYDKPNGAGAESLLATARITHYEGGTTIDLVEKSRTLYRITYLLTARDADGDTVKLHHRSVEASTPSESYSNPTPTSEGSFSAQPHGLEVTYDRGLTDRYIEAWAEDVNGNKSGIARAALPMVTSSDQENALTSFAASDSFPNSPPCNPPPSAQILRDTLTWVKNCPFTVQLSWCTGSGCSLPGTTLSSNAASGFQHTVTSGVQSGTGGIGSPAVRSYRILVLNQYGETIDFDDIINKSTTYADC